MAQVRAERLREHRARPRVPLELRVHVFKAGQPESVLLSHDWSSNSVFVRCREPYPPGTALTLRVVGRVQPGHPGHHAPGIELTGTVVRAVARDDASPDHPPGMAILLDQENDDLDKLVSDVARGPVAHEMRGPLVALAGGGDARARAALGLHRATYEVIDAENLPGVIDLLDHGHVPDALIAFLDCPEALDIVPDELENRGCLGVLQLCVGVGVQPRELQGTPRVPLLLLPATWPVEQLPVLLRRLVRGPGTAHG